MLMRLGCNLKPSAHKCWLPSPDDASFRSTRLDSELSKASALHALCSLCAQAAAVGGVLQQLRDGIPASTALGVGKHAQP